MLAQDLWLGRRREELFDTQIQACLTLELSDKPTAIARIYELTSRGHHWKHKASWFALNEGIDALERAGRFNPDITHFERSLSDMLNQPVSPGAGKRFLRHFFPQDFPQDDAE